MCIYATEELLYPSLSGPKAHGRNLPSLHPNVNAEHKVPDSANHHANGEEQCPFVMSASPDQLKNVTNPHAKEPLRGRAKSVVPLGRVNLGPKRTHKLDKLQAIDPHGEEKKSHDDMVTFTIKRVIDGEASESKVPVLFEMVVGVDEELVFVKPLKGSSGSKSVVQETFQLPLMELRDTSRGNSITVQNLLVGSFFEARKMSFEIVDCDGSTRTFYETKFQISQPKSVEEYNMHSQAMESKVSESKISEAKAGEEHQSTRVTKAQVLKLTLRLVESKDQTSEEEYHLRFHLSNNTFSIAGEVDAEGSRTRVVPRRRYKNPLTGEEFRAEDFAKPVRNAYSSNKAIDDTTVISVKDKRFLVVGSDDYTMHFFGVHERPVPTMQDIVLLDIALSLVNAGVKIRSVLHSMTIEDSPQVEKRRVQGLLCKYEIRKPADEVFQSAEFSDTMYWVDDLADLLIGALLDDDASPIRPKNFFLFRETTTKRMRQLTRNFRSTLRDNDPDLTGRISCDVLRQLNVSDVEMHATSNDAFTDDGMVNYNLLCDEIFACA